jgi:hypothetical protein
VLFAPKNAHNWSKVFLAEGLMKNQYMLDKIRETSLKEEAARRKQQLNNHGTWKVVGGKGTRRIVIVQSG